MKLKSHQYSSPHPHPQREWPSQLCFLVQRRVNFPNCLSRHHPCISRQSSHSLILLYNWDQMSLMHFQVAFRLLPQNWHTLFLFLLCFTCLSHIKCTSLYNKTINFCEDLKNVLKTFFNYSLAHQNTRVIL